MLVGSHGLDMPFLNCPLSPRNFDYFLFKLPRQEKLPRGAITAVAAPASLKQLGPKSFEIVPKCSDSSTFFDIFYILSHSTYRIGLGV